MIRFILSVISLFFFMIFSILLMPVEWVVGKFSEEARDKSRFFILRWYCRFLLLICGTHVTVKGAQNVPVDRPVLYTPNHRGMFDILITIAYCPGTTTFVAKKEWKTMPLLSWWIEWLHGYYLDRENIREGLKTILAAIDGIKEGRSVTIFPEGTRGKDPDERNMNPFHEGSIKIATKSGCPVVPVALTHTSEIFDDQFPKIRSRHVVLEYGEVIYPDKLSKEERKFIGRYVQAKVQAMVNANH